MFLVIYQSAATSASKAATFADSSVTAPRSFMIRTEVLIVLYESSTC
jgi:hypothetical protein